jgi:hypothetical protein
VGEPRAIPAVAEAPCEGHDFDMIVQGTTFRWDGTPHAGVPIAVAGAPGLPPQIVTRSGPDGAWQTTLSGPHRLIAPGVGRVPASLCIAIPASFKVEAPPGARLRMHVRESNLIADPMCPLRLTADAPWPASSRLLVDQTTEVVELDALDTSAALDVFVPCGARGVAVETPAGLLGGSCARGFACVDGPEARLSTQHPAPLRLDVTPPDALVETPWGPRWADRPIPWDGAPFEAEIRAVGHTPRRLTVTGDTAIALRPARAVEVRCAGFTADRCPFVPTLITPDGEVPCRWMDRFGVVCDVPIDTAVRVGDAGVWTELPPLPPRGDGPPEPADLAWLDLRPFTGGVSGPATGVPCQVTAIRSPSWFTGLIDAWTDRPRLRAARLRCEDDGSFTLPGLSPGRWSIRIDPIPGPAVEHIVEIGTTVAPLPDSSTSSRISL